MYRQVETDKDFVAENGTTWHPIATLADEAGGKCQICVDDHCYLPFLGSDKDYYAPTWHLFRELVDFLVLLPKLKVCGYKVGSANVHIQNLYIS